MIPRRQRKSNQQALSPSSSACVFKIKQQPCVTKWLWLIHVHLIQYIVTEMSLNKPNTCGTTMCVLCVLCVCTCMHATCLWHITCTQPRVTLKGFFQTAVSTWIRPEIEVKLNHTWQLTSVKLPQLWNIYRLWQGTLHAHRWHWVIMYSGQVRTMHEQASVIQLMTLVWSPFLCSHSSSRSWTNCYIVSSVVIYL